MKEQFVTYEIALALKELGFDEKCIAFYYIFDDEEKFLISTISNTNSSWDNGYISAPLWQQVIDWFREKHDIVIEIARQKYFDTYANSYAYEVVCKVYKNKELEGSVVIRDNKNNHIFYSYEEAREQAILKAIELCQNKK